MMVTDIAKTMECPFCEGGTLVFNNQLIGGYPSYKCDRCKSDVLAPVAGKEPPLKRLIRALHEKGIEVGRRCDCEETKERELDARKYLESLYDKRSLLITVGMKTEHVKESELRNIQLELRSNHALTERMMQLIDSCLSFTIINAKRSNK